MYGANSSNSGSPNITDWNFQRRSLVASMLAMFGIAGGPGADIRSLRGIPKRAPRSYGGPGSGRRQGARIARQIDKGMLSVGSHVIGGTPPLTRKQAGLA